ncbi:protein TSSC4 isoform X2 [Aplysia californica]|uniref:U5 small nuclear ribonucleoprotein TSSC4 n=1 Tax=Aplysia californica TaxID=6500 RepID=A0ABM0K3R2_APLCA|nr:protein TSSC4 isoform X2 [Aplysia californica]XP_005108059.1 protein TSSC4 isoform X2 [Aplysia californica]XP_005108060.1 protein TSSC4 isoform X2 [Aplysia californica]
MHPPGKEEDSAAGAFSLNSQSALFASRSQDIFANLGVLEEKHSAFVKAHGSDTDTRQLLKADPEEEEEEEERCSSRSRDHRQTHRSRSSDLTSRSGLGGTRGQDQERRSLSRSSDREEQRAPADREFRGSFRRPRGVAPHSRHRATPDYKKNPERWTCYSLDDVPDQDLSERSNQRAALVFLEERRKERERQERKAAGLPEEEIKFDVGYGACSQGRVSFTRRKTKTKETDDKCGGKSGQEEGRSVGSAPDPATLDDDNEGSVDVVDSEANADAGQLPERETASEVKNTGFKFKPKKQMKRNIRRKGSGSDDSDN